MPGLILGGLTLFYMATVYLDVTEVHEFTDSVKNDKPFKDRISIESEQNTVIIGSEDNDGMNEYRGFTIRLDKVQCQILADILLRMAKTIEK